MKKGWQTKKLADLVEVQNGYAFSSEDYSESGHLLIRIGNVQNGYISTAVPKFIKLPADGSLERFVLCEGDILISLTGNVGRVGVIQEEHLPAALNQRVARISIRKDSPATRELLLLFLCSDWFREELTGAGHGAAQQNVSTKDLVEIEIPVPPLSEQQRIVGILDKAFEAIATAKANTEQNLRNARALFESHLQSVFTQRGKGWAEKRLGDVVTRLTNGFVGPTRNIYHKSGVPYLLARHVKNNRLLFDGRTFISDEFNRKNKKSMLKAGDVLLVQSGHIGHSAVVTEEHEGHNCHAMIVITPIEGAFLGPFLSLFFNSSGMKQKFQEIRSGSTVPHLTCGEVKELRVVMPDLTTQQRLVDHSRELDGETQRLESIYQQKLAALDELKKSLLHQAFSGQL